MKNTDGQLMRTTSSVLALGMLLLASCEQTGPGIPSGAAGTGSGAAGTTGVAGTTGTAGNTGTAGSASPAGDAGTTGSAGDVGTAGNTGTTGDAGTTGSAGTAGDGGTTGTAGAAGSAGIAGATGTAGRGGSGGSAAGAGGSGGGGGTTTACAPPTTTLSGADAVAGTKITFNDNGGWCWYQDERAVVDTKAGKLIIGSVGSGGSRNGNIEAVVYDLAAGTKIGPTRIGNLSVDDHNAPSFNIRPDGKYVATWATHRTDCNTYYSIFDGSAWATQKTFDWKTQGCPWDGDPTHMITYNNTWYMGSTLFDLSRSVGTSPNLLASNDDGQTWSYYGRLTYTPLTGYVAGYYKYWGNNTDRIDWIGTEAHPRDANTSLWHGYMKDGKIYNSAGTVVDDALPGTSATTSAKNVDQYTAVFRTGSTVNGVRLEHAWNHDVVRYADGTIAVLGQARVTGTGSDDPDKRLLYFRFDGTSWKTTYLAKAGTKLYAAEQDYTGLGALVPDDPTTIYISTPFDPRDDTTKSAKREIWRGTTCDNGATFKWTPVTANSTKDNIRPIVPKWDANHTALLWMQGTYGTAQSYSMAIVGVLTTKP